VRNVNITNTTVTNNTYITDVWQNRVTPAHYINNRAAAVTTVPQNIFISGQRISGHAIHLSGVALAGATVAAAAPAIAPIRQSVLGPAEGRGVRKPPTTLVNRTVTVRTPPPRAPAPFEKQMAAIQANGGRALERAVIGQLQPATPAVRVRVTAAAAHPAVATRAMTTLPPGAIHPPQRPPQTPASMSLTERARALERSSLPPGPTTGTTAAPRSVHPDVYVPPPDAPRERNDRPPATQQRVYSPPQHAVTTEEETRAHAHPPAAPQNHAPAAAENNAHPQQYPQADERHRATPPAETRPAQQPSMHPQAPAHSQQPSPEPRDSAPHGDRESRERVLR